MSGQEESKNPWRSSTVIGAIITALASIITVFITSIITRNQTSFETSLRLTVQAAQAIDTATWSVIFTANASELILIQSTLSTPSSLNPNTLPNQQPASITFTSIPPTPSNTPQLIVLAPTYTETVAASNQLPANSNTSVPSVSVRISEQQFQHGRMYWMPNRDQIWVVWYGRSTTTSGSWGYFPDTYSSSDPYNDPNLVPPGGMFQPVQGFGKVWREHQNVRNLGWAISTESYYDASYTDGDGYYLLTSWNGRIMRFNEGTTNREYVWQLGD